LGKDTGRETVKKGPAVAGPAPGRQARKGMLRQRLRENGLSITMFGLFLVSLIGMSLSGWYDFNDEQQDHHQPTLGYASYLGTGHFVEGVFENWESEFLQMGAYVALTVFLFQKGSPESKKLEGEETCDEDPNTCDSEKLKNAPWPVRRGGWMLKLYSNSLSLALFGLFFLSFVLHAVGGVREYNREQAFLGQPSAGLGEFLVSPQFWWQSSQNWQSEFLSVGVLVVLSIFLRQKGSPESKAVADPHDKTGD